jgi:hypothetical protein
MTIDGVQLECLTMQCQAEYALPKTGKGCLRIITHYAQNYEKPMRNEVYRLKQMLALS